MRNIQHRTLVLLSACLLLTCPALCSADNSTSVSSAQDGTLQDAAGKKEEGKPAMIDEGRKKPAADDGPGCSN